MIAIKKSSEFVRWAHHSILQTFMKLIEINVNALSITENNNHFFVVVTINIEDLWMICAHIEVAKERRRKLKFDWIMMIESWWMRRKNNIMIEKIEAEEIEAEEVEAEKVEVERVEAEKVEDEEVEDWKEKIEKEEEEEEKENFRKELIQESIWYSC